ncbi:MAG: hypothetical protein LC715_07205 [Gammaproteobacteria bacterium]|nr:hypothetical protein [Gammaproteobacteria bacterium]
MSKRLIVHIGANKTGSSSIQHFLWTNRQAMRSAGVLVPGEKFQLSSNERGTTSEFEALLDDPDGAGKLAEKIRLVATSVPEAQAIVLTAENLAANPAAPSLFRDLAQDFDIQIKLYIRRQDEYILSTWQQWYSKIETDFWAWATTTIRKLGDWRSYLEKWETLVPRTSISVRVFERSQLDAGDVVVDFYNHLGLDIPFDRFSYDRRKLNPGLSDAVVDLVKGNKLIFDNAHDGGFYAFVEKMTGDQYMRRGRQSLITYDQRMAILGSYIASNQWVLQHYFPPGTPHLFIPPKPADYEFVSPESTDREKLEFLVSLLYRMYLQQNR